MIPDKIPFSSTNSPETDDDQSEDDSEVVSRIRARAEDIAASLRDVQPTVEHEPDTAPLEDVADSHQSVLSPSYVERTPSGIQTEGGWARTLWVGEYPDAPRDGFLEALYSAPETRSTDISIHIHPRDTRETLDSLENKIEDLEADYQYLTEKQRASARGVQKDLDDYREMYDVLRNTSMRAFDVSMYLTVRADTREDLNADDISTVARRAPSNLTPVTPRWAQLSAFAAGSPAASDRLDETFDTQTPMIGGAVGAMFPFVSGSFAEPGIEYGTYALNASPLILDRFERETGYCTMVIGRLGAGKSFATKLRLLRRAMFDDNVAIVMLDPMRGFAGVNEALDGERITVGGRRGLNPLEITPTPVDVRRKVDDIDPWSEQINWVMTFFETFFERVADHPLDERSQTLRRAVQEAYARRGITRDPETHDRDSPTIRDVITVLEEMVDHPETYGYVTEGEQESVRSDAQSLLKDLRPSFREGGDLENLARPSEFDLDSPVIYLDLHQDEGTRGRAETSLMMQVLFNSVYSRVKQTDRRVVFCIDEAHYLMNDAASLDFLERAVRHSRHFDLSIEFITQTGGEFALTPEARTIANLCSLTVLHRVNEKREKIAEWFDLSERQVEWVTSAKAGEDEDGYSEALLGVDQEGWFPVRIRASEYEAQVIDGDPNEFLPSSPGPPEETPPPESRSENSTSADDGHSPSVSPAQTDNHATQADNPDSE